MKKKYSPFHFFYRYRFLFSILLLFICYNAAVFFGGKTMLPIAPSFTMIAGNPFQYDGPHSHTLTTIDPAGTLNVSYIFDVVFTETIKDGSLPFWNPYQALGQPVLENGISSILSFWNIFLVLFSPAYLDIFYMLLWIAGVLFFYLYMYTITKNKNASSIAAIVFLLSGFYHLYLPLREYIAVVSWFPLLLYAVEKTSLSHEWKWRHLLFALGVYGTMSAGQPEVYFVSLIFTFVYAIIRFIQTKKPLKKIIAVFPGTLSGLFLAAPAWGTFYEYGLHAFSNHTADSLIGMAHLPYETSISFIFPFLFNKETLVEQTPGWIVGAMLFFLLVGIALYRFMNKKTQPIFWIFLITSILLSAKIWGAPIINLIGALPLFDRIIYPRYSSFLLHISLCVLIGIGYALIDHLNKKKWCLLLLIWSSFIIFSLFFIDVLANKNLLITQIHDTSFLFFGINGMIWSISLPLSWYILSKKIHVHSFWWYFFIAVSCVYASIPISMHGYSIPAYKNIILFSFLIWLVYAIIYIFSIKKVVQHRYQYLLIPLTCVSLIATQLFFQITETGGLAKRHNPLKEPPFISKLQKLSQNGLYRVYSLDSNPQPNFSTPFHISNLNNVEALMPTEAANFLLRYIDSTVSPIWFAGNYSPGRSLNTTATKEIIKNEKWYDLIAVKYIVSQQILDFENKKEEFPLVYKNKKTNTFVYENTSALPRLFFSTQSIVAKSEEEALEKLEFIESPTTVITENPDLLLNEKNTNPMKITNFDIGYNHLSATIETNTPGILTVTDAYYPGWRVYVNNEEKIVERINGTFRGVFIENAGTHNVRFVYRPVHWKEWNIVALLGAFILTISLVWQYRKNKSLQE